MRTKISSPKIGKVSITLFATGVLVALLAPLFFASPAQAECTFEGETYQTGEKSGPYECYPDGEMR